MNVICIHRVPYKKPCGACGRDGEHGISDGVREIAREMICERILIKRSYDDARILMKLTTMSGISCLTGLSMKTLRKMQKEIEGELCRNDIATPR